MKQSIALVSTLAGLMTVTSPVQAVPDAPGEWEKCGGIAKAGKNDCGAKDGSHQCAGMSTVADSAVEWVYLPKGTCDKLTGGTVLGVKPAKT